MNISIIYVNRNFIEEYNSAISRIAKVKVLIKILLKKKMQV